MSGPVFAPMDRADGGDVYVRVGDSFSRTACPAAAPRPRGSRRGPPPPASRVRFGVHPCRNSESCVSMALRRPRGLPITCKCPVSVHVQERLDLQRRAQHRHRAGDAPAVAQVVERVHREPVAHVQPAFLQPGHHLLKPHAPGHCFFSASQQQKALAHGGAPASPRRPACAPGYSAASSRTHSRARSMVPERPEEKQR